MTKAIIFTLPRDLRRKILGLGNAADVAIVSAQFKENPHSFHMSAHIAVDDALVGEDVAEEMFDITNNPGRQEEREEKYGNGPSVSVCDVVSVIGQGDWICCSMGWQKL